MIRQSWLSALSQLQHLVPWGRSRSQRRSALSAARRARKLGLEALEQRQVPASIAEFGLATGSGPTDITTGPDGNLWFTEQGTNKIGEITTFGAITEFTLATGSEPTGITTGPDGNLWFTEQGANKIGEITTGGTIIEFELAAGSEPTEITTGSNGNLWFTEQGTNKIGEIVPSGQFAGTITEFTLAANSHPYGITSGPNGNLWFTENGTNKVGQIVPSGIFTGTVSTYSLSGGAGPTSITTGSDGNLWFAETGGSNIGQVTTNGTVTEFEIPGGNAAPQEIVSGPEGDLYFTEGTGNNIVQMTTEGDFTNFAIPTSSSGAFGITIGPDNHIWFAESSASQIGRLNLNPTAANDSYTTSENTAANPTSLTESAANGILANDTDPEGDPLIVAGIVSQPSHGSVNFNPDGSFTYIPNNNYVGTDSFTYQATDGEDYSNTATVNLTIHGTTTTTLTAAPDPSVFGQSKTLTATVSSSGIATGTVSFYDGAALLGTASVSAGVATFTTSAFAVGTHSLTAVYSGDSSFSGSTSSVDTATVTQASTATTLTSAPNPSVFGQPVTLTATVTAVAPGAGTPTGTVSFYDGAILINTATVNGSGVASFTLTPAAIGTFPLTAVYNGDTNYTSSTSLVDDLTVDQADTTTTLTAAPDPSVFGQSATLTATVAAVAPGAGTATGTVTFYDGGAPIGTVTLSGGVATLTTSSLSVGTHSLTAVYNGDTDFHFSESSVDTKTVTQAATTTTLTSAPDPSVFGQSETLTATVTAVAPGAGTATGMVSFFDGATLLGTASVSGGVATFTTSTLSAGSHALTAVFGGDSSFTSSTAPVDTTVVDAAPVAVNDSYNAVENAPLVVSAASGVLANDTQAQGDALTAVLVAAPAHGTLALNSDGSFTYTPSSGYVGPDSFTYKDNDGYQTGNTVTVTLTVAVAQVHNTRTVAASATGGLISVMDNGVPTILNAAPYPGFAGGFSVAVGNLLGDGGGDIATVVASGGPSLVTVYSGKTLTPVLSFFAFPSGYTGGASIAVGDLYGTGHDEIIVGQRTGGSAVAVYDGQTGALVTAFFAYPEAPVGVSVAVGDVNGDGKAEIVTTPTSIAPLVRVFNGTGTLVNSFFAYPPVIGGSGFSVAVGDLNGDGVADIVVGTNVGGADYAVVYNGDSSLRTILALGSAPASSSVRGPQLAVADYLGNGSEDLLFTVGTTFGAFDGITLSPIAAATLYPETVGGVYVG